MSEFLDHKDSGPVILSHFYLLTGARDRCGSRITRASSSTPAVLSRRRRLARLGRRSEVRQIYWPGGSSKTVEGTVAFVTSIMVSAWLLRLVGWCEQFDSVKYGMVVAALGVLEGVSDQHDNLVLPILGISWRRWLGCRVGSREGEVERLCRDARRRLRFELSRRSSTI